MDLLALRSPLLSTLHPLPSTLLFHPMKHGFLDHLAVAQMLDDDALEELGGDARVPDAVGVDDDDRSARAYA